jgi:hypothetical protein
MHLRSDPARARTISTVSQPSASSSLLGPVGQFGYVVRDAEEAARRWAQRTGIGPWRVLHGLRFDHCRTVVGDGRHDRELHEVEMVVTIASAYSGDIEIELIAPTNDVESMYSAFLATGGLGAHHVCFYPEDYQAALDALFADGMNVLLEGALAGIPFAYFGDGTGQILELGDLPPEVRSGRARRVAASAAWDGQDPVRVTHL